MHSLARQALIKMRAARATYLTAKSSPDANYVIKNQAAESYMAARENFAKSMELQKWSKKSHGHHVEENGSFIHKACGGPGKPCPGGPYCDMKDDCFPTGRGLANHVASTGHPVAAVTQQAKPFSEYVMSKPHGEVQPAQQQELVQGALTDINQSDLSRLKEKKKGWFTNLLGELKKRYTLDGSSVLESLYNSTPYQSNTPQSYWSGASTSEGTSAYWVFSGVKHKNEFVPPNLFGKKVSKQEVKEVELQAMLSQELTRAYNPTYDPKTDTILLYRGVDGALGMELLAAKKGRDSITAKHRAVESWSVTPIAAKSFGVAMLRARIPVEHVVSSFLAARLHSSHEAEYLIATPGTGAVYSPEDIFDKYKEETAIYKLGDEENAKWASIGKRLLADAEKVSPTAYPAPEPKVYTQKPYKPVAQQSPQAPAKPITPPISDFKHLATIWGDISQEERDVYNAIWDEHRDDKGFIKDIPAAQKAGIAALNNFNAQKAPTPVQQKPWSNNNVWGDQPKPIASKPQPKPAGKPKPPADYATLKDFSDLKGKWGDLSEGERDAYNKVYNSFSAQSGYIKDIPAAQHAGIKAINDYNAAKYDFPTQAAPNFDYSGGEESSVYHGNLHKVTKYTMPDGRTLYTKDYEKPEHVANSVWAGDVYNKLGIAAPKSMLNETNKELVSTGVDGQSISSGAYVDKQKALRASALRLVMGDWDGRDANWKILDDGTPVPIDLDMSGAAVTPSIAKSPNPIAEMLDRGLYYTKQSFGFDKKTILQEVKRVMAEEDLSSIPQNDNLKKLWNMMKKEAGQ